MKRLWPLTLALLGACYQAPELTGPYRCADDGSCGVEGFVCDDGVCCNPSGEPLCRSFVLDGGTCQDGSAPVSYYADLDEDGWGNENEPRLYCAKPVYDRFVDRGGDCNDNPEAGGALFYPGAIEQCDGLDNDCDGVADNGLQTRAFHPDRDGDGYGDKNTIVELCAPRLGLVENGLDCNDDPEEGGALIHPNATEICNGVDDDCNGTIDDVPGLGQPCTVPNLSGVCATGATACSAEGLVCVQTVQPGVERCNAQDDDCDGVADERPECGGPVSLLSDSDVVFGAKKLTTSVNGQTNSCVKDNPGTLGTFDGKLYSSTGGGSHVVWVERKGGRSWDLSRDAERMLLALSWTLTGSVTPAWADHFQPVILVCGPAGHLRYVHSKSKLIDAPTGSLNKYLPFNPQYHLDRGQDYGWVIGSLSTTPADAVLKEVQRIEVLVQPNANTGIALNFGTWGIP